MSAVAALAAAVALGTVGCEQPPPPSLLPGWVAIPPHPFLDPVFSDFDSEPIETVHELDARLVAWRINDSTLEPEHDPRRFERVGKPSGPPGLTPDIGPDWPQAASLLEANADRIEIAAGILGRIGLGRDDQDNRYGFAVGLDSAEHALARVLALDMYRLGQAGRPQDAAVRAAAAIDLARICLAQGHRIEAASAGCDVILAVAPLIVAERERFEGRWLQGSAAETVLAALERFVRSEQVWPDESLDVPGQTSLRRAVEEQTRTARGWISDARVSLGAAPLAPPTPAVSPPAEPDGVEQAAEPPPIGPR